MVRVIDSHTEGEPTRVVVDGGPDLGGGTLAERQAVFQRQYDWFRTSVVGEPRSSEAAVGALLCPPENPGQLAGVLYFDNGGMLDMCVHGTIGLVTTLRYLQNLTPGEYRIGTVVGEVAATLHDDHSVTVANVPSYRYAQGIEVAVDGERRVTGDVAWGGNWFYLCADHGLPVVPEAIDPLTRFAKRLRDTLRKEGITGREGAPIRHIELLGPPDSPDRADTRGFVLCPGGEYDRSPCGTGTSAKLACLAADQRLQPGQVWRQQSVIGTVFEGRYQPLEGGAIRPLIRGRAWVNGEAQLVFDADDPFVHGRTHPAGEA